MSAIVLSLTPTEHCRRLPDGGIDPVDYMPVHTRILVAKLINNAWEEFVNEIHDGSTAGPEVAEKFIRYLTR